MNEKLHVFKILLVATLAFITVGCSLNVQTPPTRQTQTITPEQKAVLVRWALKEIGKGNHPYCWRHSYGRGVGVPVSACPQGKEKDAGLCYPTCEDIGKEDWKGVGPVCWQRCPAEFRDDGVYCFKPKSYGRGVGFPWKIGDKVFSLKAARKRCEKKYGEGQCEKSGEIYYPKCREGYRAIGCCICSPRCPSGMTDIGISCQKQSKGRGVGKPMTCKEGQAYDAGLCYTPCRDHYHGVGPVCWQDCPDTQPVNCGAGCAKQSGQCVEKTVAQVVAPLEVALNVALAVTTGGSGNAAVTAAKTSAKTAIKTGEKVAARTAVKNSVKTIAQEMAPQIRNRLNGKLLQKYSQEIAEDVCLNAAEYLALASMTNDYDTKDFLMALDPTGIADVTEAYNKPKCGFDEPPPDFGR